MSEAPRQRPQDPLARAARRWPRAVALEDRRAARSYAELNAAAGRLADLLASLSLAPLDGGALADGSLAGPAAAFLLGRGPAAVVCLHAIPRAGAAALPLHPEWTDPELREYLARLGPAVLVCDTSTRDRAGALAPPRAVLVELSHRWPPVAVGVPGGGSADASGLDPRSGGEREESPGAPIHTILASSGSSGRPKAVALGPSHHLACARATVRRMLLGPSDRWLASLSPAHVGGVALVMRAAWTGARLVLRDGFDSGEVAALADAGRITHASLVPTMLGRLLEARGPRRAPLALRGLLLGGDAAIPGQVEAALELDYPLFPTYGLTEAASQVATARPEEARRFPGTVGRPLAGTEVRIGEDSEILVRGPTVMAGYVLGPAADGGGAASVSPDREGPVGPSPFTDGWLRTGDAGRLDEEGRLWVTGRLSSRIISGGVTVDPSEVEAVLCGHPRVLEAAVVGLPDAEWGERVAAVVVPGSPGALEAGDPDRLEEALDAFCRERLAPAKRPRRLRAVAALPRVANGKVDRAAVRALLA